MCLIVTKSINQEAPLLFKDKEEGLKKASKPLIAARAMKVYKRFDKIKGTRELESPYRNCLYKRGQKYEVAELGTRMRYDFSSRGYQIIIEAGMHAYTIPISSFENRVTIQCTIPKGAKYFLGIQNEIVSDKLIVGTKIYRGKTKD